MLSLAVAVRALLLFACVAESTVEFPLYDSTATKTTTFSIPTTTTISPTASASVVEDARKYITYSTVGGYFLQDLNTTTPSTFDYVRHRTLDAAFRIERTKKCGLIMPSSIHIDCDQLRVDQSNIQHRPPRYISQIDAVAAVPPSHPRHERRSPKVHRVQASLHRPSRRRVSQCCSNFLRHGCLECE